MPTRKIIFAPDEYYHVFNRGTLKSEIFLDDRDRIRFLFLILYLQAGTTPQNISRQVSYFVKHQVFNINDKYLKVSLKKRQVELASFSLVPNHFHLIIKEMVDNGISKYLHKVSNAYAKYFNTKYKKSGHLFQGPFRAVHIGDNNQLLYASAYIHRNPREIKKWRNSDHLYPWSSFQDYVQENRWDNLLVRDLVLEQFDDGNDYKKWVIDSVAKSEYDVGDLEI
jgi:putative transposase